jgi:hypothetical protein
LFGGDDARPEGAHGLEYRRSGGRALEGAKVSEGSEGTEKIQHGGTEGTETHGGEDAPSHPARLGRFTRTGWRGASFLRSPSFTSFLRVNSVTSVTSNREHFSSRDGLCQLMPARLGQLLLDRHRGA